MNMIDANALLNYSHLEKQIMFELPCFWIVCHG